MFQFTCRTLTCPFGKRPYFGKCTDIAITTDGLLFAVPLYFAVIQNQLSIPDNDQFHPDNLQSIGSNFYDLAASVLRMKAARCQKRGGSVRLNSTLSGKWTGFLVTSKLKLRKQCSLEFIIRQISEAVKQNVTYYSSSGSGVVFSIKLYKDSLNTDLDYVFEAESKISDSRYSILIDKDIFCPEISINLAEHTHVEETHVKQNFLSLFNNSNTKMNAARTLCLHEYLSVMSKISKTSGANSVKYAWLEVMDIRIYIVYCIVIMTML